MKQFNLFWKFSGIKNYDPHQTITARNLPEALEIAANDHGFLIRGETLKRNGNRRIEFWGYAGEGTMKVPAPIIQGVIANA
jgi:hypothetical protein